MPKLKHFPAAGKRVRKMATLQRFYQGHPLPHNSPPRLSPSQMQMQNTNHIVEDEESDEAAAATAGGDSASYLSDASAGSTNSPQANAEGDRCEDDANREGINDAAVDTGDLFNLRDIIDPREIAELEQLFELPSEDIDFPPSSDEEEDANGKKKEKEERKNRNRRVQKNVGRDEHGEDDQEEEYSDEEARDGKDEDAVSLKSLYTCQPDESIEFYKLPDI